MSVISESDTEREDEKCLARSVVDALAEEPSLEAVTLTHSPCPLFERNQIRRILVVKLDHLGDVLLALPALRRMYSPR